MEYGGVDGRVTGLLSRPFIDVCECQSRGLYGLLCRWGHFGRVDMWIGTACAIMPLETAGGHISFEARIG